VENVDELKRIKKNYNDIKTNFEESQKTISLQKQLNKDLENKIKILEDENKNTLTKLKNMKEKNMKYGILKEKVIKYKNELTHKDTVIDYLEKVMKTGKNDMLTSNNDKQQSLSKSRQNNQHSNNLNEESKSYQNKSNYNKFKRTEEELMPKEIIANNDQSLDEKELYNNKYINHNKDSIEITEAKKDEFKETFLNKISPKKDFFDENQLHTENMGDQDDMKDKNDNYKEVREDIYNNEENNQDNNLENSFKHQIQLTRQYLDTEGEQLNYNENRELYTNSDVNNSKSIILKKEINNLDQEIRNLQGKLRSMIDVKK